PLEDDEVVEPPMEDGAGIERGEVLDGLDAHAAAAQPEPLAGLEDAHGVGAAAADAGDLAHFLQGQRLAVAGQHHGEASGAAIACRGLLHEGDPAAEAQLAERRETAEQGRAPLSHRAAPARRAAPAPGPTATAPSAPAPRPSPTSRRAARSVRRRR